MNPAGLPGGSFGFSLQTLALCVCVFCATASGCGGQDDHKPLAVVVSGDTDGWIMPCGCATVQWGGLPRRGTYVAQLQQQSEVVYADAGGAPGGTTEYDRLKFEWILQGELAMGLAAHNLGGPEIALGADYLRSTQKRFGVPFVSANARDADGRPLAEPLRIVESGGLRIALIGVLSPQYATGSITVEPPRRCAQDAIRSLPEDCDFIVVLAYLPKEELRKLAAGLPEADVVVGGPTGQTIPPEKIGPTLLTSATNKGRFLARFDLPPRGSTDAIAGTVVTMDENLEDDPRQKSNIEQFHRELQRGDFTPDRTPFAQPIPADLADEFRIAGNESCRECHEEDCRLWDESAHADAWESLAAGGSHVDPYCQQCHTTGYGLPDGFISAGQSADRTAVGCESCHGPSKAHADDPNVPTLYVDEAKDRCIRCHDRDNSPSFDYDRYWKKIRHGQTPATKPGADDENEKATEASP